MRVTCRVLLRLEESVEVPEAALHVVVGRHLAEAVQTKSRDSEQMIDDAVSG